MNEKENEKR